MKYIGGYGPERPHGGVVEPGPLVRELEIIWVNEQARAAPFLRERFELLSAPRRRPSVKRLAAYAVVSPGARLFAGGYQRRYWTMEESEYPKGAACPREGVLPVSIRLRTVSAPALPYILDARRRRGEVLDAEDLGVLRTLPVDPELVKFLAA